MEGSKKKWVIVGLLVGLVAVAGMGGVLVYQNLQLKQEQEFASTLTINKPEEIPGRMPQQGFYDYDLTVNKAMFTIMAMDSKNQTMRLKFIYPFKLQGNEITSRVTCSRGDTKVYYGKEDRLADAEQTVYEETQVVTGRTLMQAICADSYCRTINKYCELWL